MKRMIHEMKRIVRILWEENKKLKKQVKGKEDYINELGTKIFELIHIISKGKNEGTTKRDIRLHKKNRRG